MPVLSCFTRCGLLACSSDLSDGQKIYDSMRQAYIDPKTGAQLFDLSVGTDLEARIYATSMALASARATVQRANNENNPGKANQKLPTWESIYRLAPSPTDSIATRRAAVLARAQLSRGNRYEAIVDGLTQILGANFLAYRPIAPWEAEMWPVHPGTDAGNFSRPDLPAKVMRLLEPVASTAGFSRAIAYENWNTDFPAVEVVVGDVLCIQAENLGLTETVTVTANSTTSSRRTFTAIFEKTHDVGASATTGPTPIWTSSKRFALIVVQAAASINVALRQRVNEYMERVARTVTQWAIVQPTSPGATTVGPFTLGFSPLGAVPVGTLNVSPTVPGAPVVTSASPNTGSVVGLTPVTLTGSGFALASRVQFSGVSGTQDATNVVVVNDTTITCSTPTHIAAEATDVIVTTPYGIGTGAGIFTFV